MFTNESNSERTWRFVQFVFSNVLQIMFGNGFLRKPSFLREFDLKLEMSITSLCHKQFSLRKRFSKVHGNVKNLPSVMLFKLRPEKALPLTIHFYEVSHESEKLKNPLFS